MQGTEKKSSGLNKLKSIFVTDEPTVTPKHAAPSAPVYTTSTSSGIPPVTASQTVLDPRYKEILETAIRSAQLPGVEYLKYRQSVEALKAHIPDEASRFKMAFVSLATLGTTKEQLIETVDHYLTVVEQENKKFNDAVDSKTKTSIGGNESKIADLDKRIADKVQQIQTIQQEISALQVEKGTLSQSVQEEKAKIDSSKNSWALVYSATAQEIKNDKTKMQSYL